MIKESTIQAVRDAMDIHEVIGMFENVKRNMICCPFHGEKTPSFHLWKSEQRYKCFGCGDSGDAISFLMKRERKTYPEAIEFLAEHYHIAVEHEHETIEQFNERQKLGEAKEEMRGVMALAHKKYVKCLEDAPADSTVKKYMESRGITEYIWKKWNLGFAPNDSHWLHTSLTNIGRFQPGFDCGLIARTEGQNRDFYRNRLLFPVRNTNGEVVTFGGRAIPTGDAEIDKRRPKFLNGKESEIYNKSRILFGLYEALTAKAIKHHDYVYVVEGYMDVIMMHEAGFCNTVAPCGTELTDEQLKLIKKQTDHIVFGQDGDAAGQKSIIKNIDRALSLDFKVEVAAFPNGMDPDEFIRMKMAA